jgi:decaprenylphospho-beta-D-ribofuranose 2-oxidase
MKMHSWGGFPIADVLPHNPRHSREIQQLLRQDNKQGMNEAIARGLGRSYGDSALSQNVICMQNLDHFLDFAEETACLTCSAGVSLEQILRTFLPKGWMLPVVPGTRHVTVGGAIASDIHGKNHHGTGTFCEHINSLSLLLASGETVHCSRSNNPALFHASCGGMGLTGIILNATLRLQRVPGSAVIQRTLRAQNLQEVFDAFESNINATYSVAWLDCLATGKHLGRSLLFLGEHAKDQIYTAPRNSHLSIPMNAPRFLLNRHSMGLFNTLYFQKPIKAERRIEADAYFFPLDSIAHWNRLYGRQGFLQYQCVIPQESALAGIRQVLAASSSTGKGSFLCVLKKFGPANANLLSFPMQGYTLAMDFKYESSLMPLLDELDSIVLEHGGRLYLAKDARMSAETFKSSYPQWEEFMRIRTEIGADRVFNSLQSRRLGL